MENGDQFGGEDYSDGSETEVVIQTGDKSNPKEQDDVKPEEGDYEPPEVDYQPEDNKPLVSEDATNVNDEHKLPDKCVQKDETSVISNKVDTYNQPNGELNPSVGLCDGTRCQRPYTWYTTGHPCIQETEPSPNVDVTNVAINHKEIIDLTRSGRDVKKRRNRKQLRRRSKNQPRHTKQKRHTSRKLSATLRKRKTNKPQKTSNARKSQITLKSQKSGKKTKRRHITSV